MDNAQIKKVIWVLSIFTKLTKAICVFSIFTKSDLCIMHFCKTRHARCTNTFHFCFWNQEFVRLAIATLARSHVSGVVSSRPRMDTLPSRVTT